MAPVFVAVGAALVLVGLFLLARPARGGSYRDVLAPSSSVSPEFGALVTRLNGLLFALVGAWFLWRAFT